MRTNSGFTILIVICVIAIVCLMAAYFGYSNYGNERGLIQCRKENSFKDNLIKQYTEDYVDDKSLYNHNGSYFFNACFKKMVKVRNLTELKELRNQGYK